MHSYKESFLQFLSVTQTDICRATEGMDGEATFLIDQWKRPEGGGGDTRVLSDGKVFEKAGVNTSAVHGELPQAMREKLGVEQADFFACGLSLVMHPRNPHVPTVHANVRYFEMYDAQGEICQQWFGGGTDLTPYYLYEEDVVHFHRILRDSAQRHDSSFYPAHKAHCDRYFHNSHRGEARGVGGAFYDYLRPGSEEELEEHTYYEYVKDMASSFLAAYSPIVHKRRNISYTPEQKKWQEIRRGRYVEFNLVHDRGTLFGLKTNGRIESILMSLPSTVRWEYNHHPESGTPEAKMLEVLVTPREWLRRNDDHLNDAAD